jgi:hypothetical protein
MVRRATGVVTFVILAMLLVPSLSRATGVTAHFDLDAQATAPFPSDRWTVRDRTQKTRLRIDLPKPDCAVQVSECSDIDTLNTLDGFNLQPRLSIPFSGPIDVGTVSSKTVLLVSLGGARHRDEDDDDDDGGDRHPARVVGINQVVWDVASNTLHVESDELLDQHSRYALIVTRGVKDTNGSAVRASEEFERFRHGRGLKAYRKALNRGLNRARAAGFHHRDIVAASVFTTQSITAVLEKIRDQIKASTPAPADFFLNGPTQPRTVFAVSSIRDIQFRRQVKVVPLELTLAPAARLQLLAGVEQIAFGRYSSPSYLRPDRSMELVGTRNGVPVVQATEEIYFNLFLPAGAPPPGGWPVVIYGPGTPDNKNASAYNMAAAAAARGMALISINAPGVGFGPASTLTIVPQAGAPVTFSAGGRSVDENGDGLIGSGVAPTSEGDEFLPRGSFVVRRDAMRQAAADLMALVRVIELGMDVDGDGVRDLDPARIYYEGWSFGAGYGVLFAVVEPNVRVFGLNAGGGGSDGLRLSPANRPFVSRYLERRVPSALNAPGISALAGIAANAPRFNENLPLRDGAPLNIVLSDGASATIQSPVVNTVVGAMEIQRVIENIQWVQQVNDASAYARHLRARPLHGVPAKSVIVQMNRGDQTAPNPATTAIVRAGDLADRTTYYRHDFAGQALKNPHMTITLTNDAAMQGTARALQDQFAILFESDGALFTDPDDYMAPAPVQPLFEAPIVGPLPEDPGFIP